MPQKTFWTISDKGALSPHIVDIYNFLNSKGYRVKVLEDDSQLYYENCKFVEKVYVTNIEKEIRDYLNKEYKDKILKDIETKDSFETKEFTTKQVLEAVSKYGFAKIFNKHNWGNLKPFVIQPRRHEKNKAWFYFKNGFVEVSKTGMKFKDYKELKGYVSKDVIIDHDISIIDIYKNKEKQKVKYGWCFYDLLEKISQDREFDTEKGGYKYFDNSDKLLYLMQIIGFLLHDFRLEGATDYCVIFCDEESGGSGKGLILRAIKQMTNVCMIDAKRSNFHDYHPKNLTPDVRVKVYNDIQQSFNFESIYNEITDNASINYKHEKEISLSYEDSFKIAILTNKIVRGNSASDLRRQKVFDMCPYFDDKRLIERYYKHSFFSRQWNKEDWNYFYNTMFTCMYSWLEADYNIGFDDPAYQQRKLDATYPIEFREFIDGLESKNYSTGDLYKDFKNSNYESPFIKRLNTTSFGKLMTKYFDEMKIPYQKNENRTRITVDKPKAQTEMFEEK